MAITMLVPVITRPFYIDVECLDCGVLLHTKSIAHTEVQSLINVHGANSVYIKANTVTIYELCPQCHEIHMRLMAEDDYGCGRDSVMPGQLAKADEYHPYGSCAGCNGPLSHDDRHMDAINNVYCSTVCVDEYGIFDVPTNNGDINYAR